MVGISGPFVVASVSTLEKSAVRRILVLVFFIENVVKVVVYSANGILIAEAAQLSATALPAVGAGLVTGAALHNRVSEKTFRYTLAGALVAVGIQPLVHAVA